MYIGQLAAGQPYDIEFACSPSNTGTTSVGRMWLPRPGQTAPDVVLQFVAPGGAQTIDRGIVPTNMMALQIDVHPPKGGGGTLEVIQGSTRFNTPPVTGETTWIFAIV